MDSKISEHFTLEKYPEFSTWTASMSRADAEEYVMESQVRETLYHETFPPRAAVIRGDGVDVTKSTDTVFFAAGHYMAAQRNYAEKRFGEEMLEQKALLKTPLRSQKPASLFGLAGFTRILQLLRPGPCPAFDTRIARSWLRWASHS